MQISGEQLDAIITRLKKILKKCDYGDEKEKPLMTKLCLGVARINCVINSSEKQHSH